MKEVHSQIPVTAVIPDFISNDSWVAGESNSKIEYVDYFAKYNIKPYTFLSDTELQARPFETWGCVDFSALDVIECAINLKVKFNLLKPSSIQWLKDKGIIVNDKANCSDRYVFIKSKIEKGKGTSGDNVAETIRKVSGLIPESMLPWGGNNWEEYADPTVITKEMEDLGQEFLKRFRTPHDWVVTPYMTFNDRVARLEYYSKHLPLQIFVPVCSGWSGNTKVNACYATVPEHAAVYAFPKHLIHDQYHPDWKTLASDYPILWAKRYDIIDNPDFVESEVIKTDSGVQVDSKNWTGKAWTKFKELLVKMGIKFTNK